MIGDGSFVQTGLQGLLLTPTISLIARLSLPKRVERYGRAKFWTVTRREAAWEPNKGVELTGNSVRSCVAPAAPSSSRLAFGIQYHGVEESS